LDHLVFWNQSYEGQEWLILGAGRGRGAFG
jgi:hypothetical protein